jgi:hypothetical protein
MATKKIKRFQEGGMSEDEDKAAGLEASRDDKVGFLERLRMGNIDDPESEAYKRFGAGRGRAARVPVEDRAGTPVEEIRARDTSAPASSGSSTTITKAMQDAASAEGMRTGADNPRESGPAIMMPATGPAVGGKPRVNVNAAKPAASQLRSSPASSKMQEQTYRRTSGATASDAASGDKTRYSPPRMTAEMRKQAEDQAIKPYYPEEYLAGGPGLKSLNTAAKALANRTRSPSSVKTADEILALPSPTRRLGYDMKALPAPTKRLEYDKAGAIAKRRADRSAARDAEMQAENAAATSRAANRQKSEELANELRKGQAKTKFTSQSKAPSKRTKKFDDSETGVEFKRGGKAMKSGGAVNPASKRADGIATRGKTRCKIC